MFQIIGAMAEFERSLIAERTKAGLRHAVAKGKRLGRPRADVDRDKLAALRASGASWRSISRQMGLSRSSLHLALAGRSQNVPESGVLNV